ncbi:hypothetical protein HDU92_000655 [Lobulomyces angularis]|nr:hypothetical protein HDU92_000655 [Lobulomyces angularis]
MEESTGLKRAERLKRRSDAGFDQNLNESQPQNLQKNGENLKKRKNDVVVNEKILFVCMTCGEKFSKKFELLKHELIHENIPHTLFKSSSIVCDEEKVKKDLVPCVDENLMTFTNFMREAIPDYSKKSVHQKRALKRSVRVWLAERLSIEQYEKILVDLPGTQNLAFNAGGNENKTFRIPRKFFDELKIFVNREKC